MTYINIPDDDLRRAWSDKSKSLPEIAASLGIGKTTLQTKVKVLGLPPRTVGMLQKIKDHDDFAAHWAAGTSIRRLAEMYKMHTTNIKKTAKRMGLPARPTGRPKAETLMRMAVKTDQRGPCSLLDHMARTAAAEQRQFILAEMADQVGSKFVGADKARAA